MNIVNLIQEMFDHALTHGVKEVRVRMYNVSETDTVTGQAIGVSVENGILYIDGDALN